MELVHARWLEAVRFVTIKSAERRAPSAERRLWRGRTSIPS